MTTHVHDLWNDGFVCPLHAKDFCELLEILRASFTDTKDRVAEPRHAEVGKFLVKELDA